MAHPALATIWRHRNFTRLLPASLAQSSGIAAQVLSSRFFAIIGIVRLLGNGIRARLGCERHSWVKFERRNGAFGKSDIEGKVARVAARKRGRERVSIKNWETQLMMDIRGMTPEERTRLESIDRVLRSDNVREQIRPIVERVRAELARKNEALMTWEPIPLTVFGRALPREIQSAWVFVLRAGADTGEERHSNSHMRM